MKVFNFFVSKVLLILLLGSLCDQTLNAQQFDKNTSREEIQEYMEYVAKLQQSQNVIGAKSNQLAPLVMPAGTNPFTSQGLAKGNIWSWREYLMNKGNRIAVMNKNKKVLPVYKEKEKPNQRTNNSFSQAEQIPELMNKKNGKAAITIQGDLGGGITPDNAVEFFSEEDNSYVDQATPINFTEEINELIIFTPLTPFDKQGTTTGDVDLYSVDLLENENLFYQVLPSDTNLDLFLVVFDSDQNILAQSTSQFGNNFFRATFTAPADDTYNILIIKRSILEQTGFIVADITDPSTIYPVGNPGEYVAAFSKVKTEPEVDIFDIPLKKGDVFGIASFEELLLNISLFKPDGSLAIETNVYGIVPNEETPLPLEGNVGFHYVAPEDGTYKFRLEGLGQYEGEVVTSRPGLEGRSAQLIYLDFTGATLTLREFFGVSDEEVPIGTNPFLDDIRNVSPLSSFLERWGIENTPLNTSRLAQMISAVVEENLKEDLRESGINPSFNVQIISDFGIENLGDRIRRSLERANIPFSTVIVGGSIAEFGIDTIGVADGIDVGNYQVNNTAITLLDVLSEPEDIDGAGTSFPTINNIPFNDAVTSKMELVAEAVGNITAHEAGHFLGNWHTRGNNATFSIMDEGGFGIFTTVGLPNGGVFGDDNIDVDFVKDQYSSFENFNGLDETDVNTAFALSSRRTVKANDNFNEQLIASLEEEVIKELYGLLPSNFYSYPSPVSKNQESTLVIAPQLSGTTVVSLYDIQGRKITQIFDGEIEAGQIKEINVDFNKLDVTPGFYFYKMNSEAGEKTHAIIVK